MRTRYVAVAIGVLVAASAAGAVQARPDRAGIVLVSRDSGRNGKAIPAAEAGTISGDGRYATFAAGAGLFLRDLRTRRTRRIGTGGDPVLSAGGRFVAYTEGGKVIALDRRSGTRSVVSQPLPSLRREAAGSGFSSNPSISADGRYVAFQSYSRGLVDDDGNGRPDHGYPPYQLYLRDTKTRTTTLISRGSGDGGAIGDGESREPAISANGRYLAFSSEATNLTGGAPRRGTGVYVRDLATGRLRAVQPLSGGSGHPVEASRPVLSASGRYIAFDLQPFGRPSSLVVRDLRTGGAINASQLTPNPLELAAGAPALSADGRFVAFRAGPREEGLGRLYVVDLRTRKTKPVHRVSAEGGDLSFSADGRFLLFDTFIDANLPKGSEPSRPAEGEAYRLENAHNGPVPRS